MRDAASLPGDDLIARAHDVLSGAQLDLPRPGETRQQRRNVDRAAGKRTDRLRDRDGGLLAHRVERDRPRRDRGRVAVLDPEDDPLARAGRRQASVAVRRPGIGVMGARERPVACVTGLAIGVERVLDDVVPGRAGDMDEELPGELAEPELLAYPAAVDRNRTALAGTALSPFG